MMSPRVTIAIPTYNRADFLAESLSSALAQTFTDFEVVIADNASTDHTADVVASFTDPRIHYHRHPSNIGQTANWQFTFNQAQGEFVAPLADDDLYLPDHLATAIEVLEQYPEVAYYTCPAEYFGRNHGLEFYRPVAITDFDTRVIYFAPEQAVNFLGIDNPGPMNSMVCRKKALHSSLFWGPPGYLPQDLLLMSQLMAQGGFVFCNRVNTRFRVHDSNTSIVSKKNALLKFNCMVWYGIRWLAQFFLNRQLCTLTNIEAHGLNSPFLEGHVVPLVLGLGSYDSSPEFFRVAKKIFKARKDMDTLSSRCRLARRVGFWIIPFLERVTQFGVGWRPR